MPAPGAGKTGMGSTVKVKPEVSDQVVTVRGASPWSAFKGVTGSPTIDRDAEANGMYVVRTFVAAGKRGLQVAGGTGMQQLIEAVRAGRADFLAIAGPPRSMVLGVD